MPEKKDQCIYHASVGDYPATHLVRITCPVCGYFRVAGVCNDCYNGITSHIKNNDGAWPCPNKTCTTGNNHTRVRYREFWTLMGAA